MELGDFDCTAELIVVKITSFRNPEGKHLLHFETKHYTCEYERVQIFVILPLEVTLNEPNRQACMFDNIHAGFLKKITLEINLFQFLSAKSAQ